jgi:hypothetical protein
MASAYWNEDYMETGRTFDDLGLAAETVRTTFGGV